MELLFSILAEYGWGLFLIILAIYFILNRVKDSIVSSVLNVFRNKKKLEIQEHLKLHPLFSNLTYLSNVELYSIRFEKDKPYKNELARDLLISYVNAVRAVSCDFACMDMEEWSVEKWTSEALHKTGEIRVLANKTMHQAGIPEPVINNFNVWMANTFDLMHDNINRIGASKIYETNEARTYTLFFTINILVVSTIIDAEKTFKYLDWGVSGKYYKDKLLEA